MLYIALDLENNHLFLEMRSLAGNINLFTIPIHI
jgi:hypothetical protein